MLGIFAVASASGGLRGSHRDAFLAEEEELEYGPYPEDEVFEEVGPNGERRLANNKYYGSHGKGGYYGTTGYGRGYAYGSYSSGSRSYGRGYASGPNGYIAGGYVSGPRGSAYVVGGRGRGYSGGSYGYGYSVGLRSTGSV